MSNTQPCHLSRGEVRPAMPKQTIVLSFEIKAESRRVLYALSIAEYIEAWLQAPTPDALSVRLNAETEQGFRADVLCGDIVRSTIYGSSRVVSPNHVSYIWNKASPWGVCETLVDLTVVDNFDGCILGLEHRGFETAAETAWHCRMWNQSISRLRQLIVARAADSEPASEVPLRILPLHSPKPSRGKPGLCA